jgi:DNA-binding NarL/FixJ family response regulator
VEVIASVAAADGVSGLNEHPAHEIDLINAADVVLTDAAATTGLSFQGGFEGRRTGATKPDGDVSPACVVLSDDEDPLGTGRLSRPGVALLPTTATADQILAAIEAVAAGLMVLHADHAGSYTNTPSEDPLTPREREVLHMLAAGLGNKEIANRLRISDHTAKFHVSQILAKLSAASRAEAVSIGMRRGLVPL